MVSTRVVEILSVAPPMLGLGAERRFAVARRGSGRRFVLSSWRSAARSSPSSVVLGAIVGDRRSRSEWRLVPHLHSLLRSPPVPTLAGSRREGERAPFSPSRGGICSVMRFALPLVLVVAAPAFGGDVINRQVLVQHPRDGDVGVPTNSAVVVTIETLAPSLPLAETNLVPRVHDDVGSVEIEATVLLHAFDNNAVIIARPLGGLWPASAHLVVEPAVTCADTDSCFFFDVAFHTAAGPAPAPPTGTTTTAAQLGARLRVEDFCSGLVFVSGAIVDVDPVGVLTVADRNPSNGSTPVDGIDGFTGFDKLYSFGRFGSTADVRFADGSFSAWSERLRGNAGVVRLCSCSSHVAAASAKRAGTTSSKGAGKNRLSCPSLARRFARSALGDRRMTPPTNGKMLSGVSKEQDADA